MADATLVEIRDLLAHSLIIQKRAFLVASREELKRLDDRDRLVLDGSKSDRSLIDVSKAIGVPRSSVQRIWHRLATAGVMHEDPATPGRYIPLFSVAEVDAALGDIDD
jgi:hypothetical protein